ncbi:MAG: PASTA domain-containing protein [Balneolaceae bacterium]|nr:PASTA domain-containing protein [Balneolaceae bacterium]
MIKKILTSKKFYLSLLGFAVAGAGLLLLFDSVLMPAYTNYNEGITIPDVTQVSLEEAESILASYGLRYEVADRRANSAYPADYVIDQAPAPTKIVKPNRKIYLTVNTAIKPHVVVPNVENLSIRNAEIQLQNYGLKVGSRSYESSRFKNVILRQSIPEGTTVEKGTVVDLVVSDGLGNRMIEVPEITGLKLPEAQLKLREAGFRIEIRFQPAKDVPPNTVLDYSPKETKIIEGETLTLVISERFEAIEQIESSAINVDSTDNNQTTPPDSLDN